MLQDLANELHLKVISCVSDGLRYAFVLDRGRFGKLPTHVDYPFTDNGKVLVRVVYGDKPQPAPTLAAEIRGADDQTLVRQGVGAFLKVFDDIQRRDEAAPTLTQKLPTFKLMKLNLLFIMMDLLTLLAYPLVYVYGKLRSLARSKESIRLV